MRVDQQAIQDRVIAEHAHEVHTTADAIRVSLLVGEAIDAAYNEQPLAHTKRIVRTDEGFTDGACCGYLAYFDQFQGKLLLDADIAKLLKEWLADGQYSDLFNAGYVVSFVEGLLEDRDLFAR
jgi:hypothetical protein